MRGKRVPQVTHAHTFDGQTTADVIMGGDMLAELEDEYSKHMIEIVVRYPPKQYLLFWPIFKSLPR